MLEKIPRGEVVVKDEVAEARLEKLLAGMDVPDWKRTRLTYQKLQWLESNLGKRNSGHEWYGEAMELITKLKGGGQ